MTGPTFVGSFPAADFPTSPRLPEIAFLGRSNVGKSSLINAVTGVRTLARVSKTPGKTRACNVYRVGTWYLVDLPGYGYARASKAERDAFRRLIEDYVEQREPLRAVVWLLDIRRDPSPDDVEMADRFAQRALPLLAVLTKVDKIPWGQRRARLQEILSAVQLPPDQAIATSARTGEGVKDLRESIEALARSA